MSEIGLWSELVQWVVLLAEGAVTCGLVYVVTALLRREGPAVGPPAGTGLAIGATAPPLDARDALSNKAVRLSDYIGRPVVLVFLSPSCTPCVDLVPSLNRLAKRERETQVIAVVEDGRGTDYTRVVNDETGAVSDAFQVRRMPLMYVVDPEGKIALRTVPNTLLDLEDTLNGLERPTRESSWMKIDAGRDGEGGDTNGDT